MRNILPEERTEDKIHLIRGHKVMLDHDLAILYKVSTKVLVQAVKRKIDRFPIDFMFQLSKQENQILRSQFVTSRWGGRRYLPFAFTEQGVAMLSSVINSKRAILVNIQIMRIFTKLRKILASHSELMRKIDALEKKYDQNFKVVFDAIKALVTVPETKKINIGFLKDRDK